MSKALTVTPMNATEARTAMSEIQTGFQELDDKQTDLRVKCLDFREREGFKAMGYATIEACIEAVFNFSRQHFYRMANAAETVKLLVACRSPAVKKAAETVSTNTVVELRKLKDEKDQVAVFKEAVELADKDQQASPSPDHIKKAMRKLKESRPKTGDGAKATVTDTKPPVPAVEYGEYPGSGNTEATESSPAPAPAETPSSDQSETTTTPAANTAASNTSLVKDIEKLMRKVDELDDNTYAIEKAEMITMLRRVHSVASALSVVLPPVADMNL